MTIADTLYDAVEDIKNRLEVEDYPSSQKAEIRKCLAQMDSLRQRLDQRCLLTEESMRTDAPARTPSD